MATAYALELAPLHSFPDHPERPGRLAILEAELPAVDATPLEFEPAALTQVGLVHHAGMIGQVEEACRRGVGVIDPAPTYAVPATFTAALRAAGASLTCVDAVMRGQFRNAFAIARPPGHHAEPDRAMGFCIFNNVAIAARHALESGVARLAIIDFDAHHGNGTQAAFLDDERVLYMSTHQWGIYPGTGWFEEAPHARQRILNVPLPAGAGDRAFAWIAADLLQNAVGEFEPELMLVSCGFDAHWKDPLTSLGLSTSGFYDLARKLVALADQQCGGRIIFTLEGGYDPAIVAEGAGAVFAALTGGPFTPRSGAASFREPDVRAHLATIRALHRL